MGLSVRSFCAAALILLPVTGVRSQAATVAAAGASEVQPKADKFAFPFEYPCETPRYFIPGAYVPPPSHNCSLHTGDVSETFCRRGAPTWAADTLWCSYPNGDEMARHAVMTIKTYRSARKDECHLAMKAFLCTLYNRPCNATGGLIRPVCMYDCRQAYKACGYSTSHINLQCSEFLKSGWVTYAGDTEYGLTVLNELDWNTGMPSCEPALLRPGYSVKEVILQSEPLQNKGFRWFKEKTGISNTSDFSGAARRDPSWLLQVYSALIVMILCC